MPDNRSGQDNLAITDFQSSTYGFHESRVTKHESRPFFACFGRRVVKDAGWRRVDLVWELCGGPRPLWSDLASHDVFDWFSNQALQ